MKRPSQHIEWLSLIEVSGPFLAVGLLEKAFPQGLEAVETPRRQKLHAAYDEWCEAVDEDDAQLLALHREWVQLVLADILEYSQEVLFENSASEEPHEYRDPEHGVAFAPSLVVRNDGDTKPRLLISVYPPGTDLEKVKTNDGWPVSLMERMVLLCRSTGVRLGLLTNGDRWMLVNAPVGATSSHASWYARLWFQEPLTLKAFQSLLGIRRFFGPKDEALDSLLEKSLEYQEEVTDTLGAQVRRAVEVLVQCLDKADQDRNRELLRDVSPSELYEAGLTVMMRLVFVLCAEERGLLLLGDQVYDQCYAVSTLRGHLGEDADRYGPEVLERRHDAWTRLLSVFRAVYGGIEHESLRLPAMGGSLFDPDRFPFLEGRLKDTRWRETPAAPLPIDNRTVLLLLEALQVLEQPGGALLLSYRALDVEQIGHVYEGLLEHTVARVPHITVGLAGSKKAKNPNLPLADLESARMDGEAALLTILLEATERSEPALRKDLKREVDAEDFGRLLLVCGGDVDLAERIRPFSNLLRTDAWGEPIVYRANSFMVTLGADRRETGTHYTPKSLTENIVSTTLDPVAYIGPAEGLHRENWRLKSSSELLDLKICDPAMGSGAFLVQACRWLGERVVEAWANDETAGKVVTIDGDVRALLDDSDPMPAQLDERLVIARRLIAERCLYGVDINPLAVELAKLSIWLVTMSKGRPFGFLDHNLRSGDSLVGIHKLDQLTSLSMNPHVESYVPPLFENLVRGPIAEALDIRKSLRLLPIRDIRDVESMARLDRSAREKVQAMEIVADALIGEALSANGRRADLKKAMETLSVLALDFLNGGRKSGVALSERARMALSVDVPKGGPPRRPFHWPLEFPEVFLHGTQGFNAIVGNPPFLGGVRISETLGDAYNTFLTEQSPPASRKTDLCAFFFRRSFLLLQLERSAFGLLATNSISQGTTRKGGLAALVKQKCRIICARPSFKWPGKASVIASLVVFFKGDWEAPCYVDDAKCEYISDLLTPEQSTDTTVHRLAANHGLCFQGSSILGLGFFITPQQARTFLDDQPECCAVVKPAMGGRELNEEPVLTPPRWIIDMYERNEEEAKKYSRVFAYLEKYVKPERMLKDPEKYPRLVQTWWKYWHSRTELYDGIQSRNLQRVLVRARVSDHHMLAFLPGTLTYTEQLAVFLLEDWWAFALLQSSFHEWWTRRFASTLKTDVRYIPTDCFGTFPFPTSRERLTGVGQSYYEHRQMIMASRGIGLTKIYNRFHDVEDVHEDISALRKLHCQMDAAVAEAYNWGDIALQHDFCRTSQGIRYAIAEPARREVLERLVGLNHQIHREDVRLGLGEKCKTNGGCNE